MSDVPSSPHSRGPELAALPREAAAPTGMEGGATDEPDQAGRLMPGMPGSMLSAAGGALGPARLARRIQRRRRGGQHASPPRQNESGAEQGGSRAQVIEPTAIEQHRTTPAEQRQILAEAVKAERADGDRRALDERVAGMVKTNIMRTVVEARRALERGIGAFVNVANANPTLQRATPETLGGFAGAVCEWLKSTALAGIDKVLAKPEGVQVLSKPPKSEGDEPAAPERDLTVGVRKTFDKGADKLTGGAVEAKDGALLLGTAGSAVSATKLLGDFLEEKHQSWVKEVGVRTIGEVCGRMRDDFDDAMGHLINRVELATPAQVDALAARFDITKPPFSASDVSDRLHVLFLESMRGALSVNDYLDAVHSLRDRLDASRQDATEQSDTSSKGGKP